MKAWSAALLCALLALTLRTEAQQPVQIGLQEAVAEALAASPRLRAPLDQTETADIQRRLASSRFGLKLNPSFSTGADPSLSGQRSMGVDITRRLPTGTQVQASANTYSYGAGASALHDAGYSFSLSQPLLQTFGHAATFELTNARRSVETATRNLDAARQELIVAVAQAYFDVIRQRRLVDAGRRSVERARQLRAASQARAKVGLATELDVLRADLLASQAESSLGVAEERESTALDDFKLLIGRNPDDSVSVDGNELTDDALAAAGLAPELTGYPGATMAPDRPEAADAFVSIARGRRLKLREANDRVKDAERAANVAKWNLLPPIEFTVGYTKRGLGTLANPIFDQLLTGWKYGITTSYSLDRADANAAQATAQIGVRGAERDALDAQRQVDVEVRRAHRAWLRTVQTIDLQRKSADLADRQLKIAEIRYERGLAGNFDVVEAENNLFQAQSALVGAEIDRAIAGLTLKLVTGTLDPDAFRKVQVQK